MATFNGISMLEYQSINRCQQFRNINTKKAGTGSQEKDLSESVAKRLVHPQNWFQTAKY
jgi:hypothetical protein